MHVVLVSPFTPHPSFGPMLIPAQAVRNGERIDILSVDEDRNGLIVGATQKFIDTLISRNFLRLRQVGDEPMFKD